MKKLAKKVGLIWILLAGIPTASIICIVGKSFAVNASIVISIQIPFLLIQLFSIGIAIIYRKEIFN